jgi:hypothetical protein
MSETLKIHDAHHPTRDHLVVNEMVNHISIGVTQLDSINTVNITKEEAIRLAKHLLTIAK